ncbi:DUF1385 domain-containing protein [Candidatus Woesearchaeota archaeon]|nr:DUF1385 domain-containing protein [Candidatus Woesearchaeota archaeon]
MERKRLNIGGQAVIEGVLIRSPNYFSIAVRRPDGRISVKRERIMSSGSRIARLFFIRGIVALYETLVIGFKAIMHSANESTGEDEKLGKREVALTVFVSIIFAVILFIGIPFFLSALLYKNNSLMFNIADGILRASIFVIYIAAISLIPDVRTMFRYHGAEHMAIHAYEAGKKLQVREVRRFEIMHPRCGTSFLLFVLLLSIVVFSAVTSENLIVKFLSRILLLPVIAGLSYELLKFSAKHKSNILLKLVVLPGLMLQKITTKTPTDRQIGVAIKSLKDVVEAEKEQF